MTDIRVPYSFVPLPRKVFAPDWAYNVSHDIPFKDSLDGFIEFELVNHGDICVGSGGKEGTRKDKTGDKEINSVKWARHPEDKDRLVIPGTSVKGMLRNVLEIVSLARLTPDSMYQIRKFSHRILGKTGNNTENDYMKEYKEYDRCYAWLKFDSETKSWKLRKCRSNLEIVKIFDDDINKFLGLGEDNRITNCDPATGFTQQSAEDKYEKARKSAKGLDLNKKVKVTLKTETPSKGQPYERVVNISFAGFGEESDDKSGIRVGYVVFSNFRVAKNEDVTDMANKAFSYVFPADDLGDWEPVPAGMVEGFTAVSDSTAKTFKYLLKHQNNELGIPVWAFTKDKKLKALGFAKMPRLLCDYDTEQVTAPHQWGDDQEWDFADELYFSLPETMFGTVRKQCGHMSLKSRISFTDMVSDRVSQDDFKPMEIVLNSPKPSFTAMYLEDNQTYSSKSAKCSGYKRYRCQEKSTTGVPGKDGVTSELEVLKNPKTFRGKLMFHNLKREELGALLWCLRFGETLDDSGKSPFFHNIGHGKPYGLGAVQFRRISAEVADYDSFGMKRLSTEELDSMVRSFSDLMDREFEKAGGSKKLWSTSVQVEFIRSLAVLHDDYVHDSRVYNDLEEFSKIKNKPMPETLRVQVVNGEAVKNPKDVIDRNGPSDIQYRIIVRDLGRKYYGAHEFKDILDEFPDSEIRKKCDRECSEAFTKWKQEIDQQNMYSKISCEVIRNFKASASWKKLKESANPLPIRETAEFLENLNKVSELTPADKDVLNELDVLPGFKQLTKPTNPKSKERRRIWGAIKNKFLKKE